MKPMSERHFAVLRRHMVEVIELHMDLMSDELGRSGLDARVAAALIEVPRHHFVPAQLAALAYHDTPLPIGFDKTISQPFIAALMIDLLAPQPGKSVLEVGTGLGYQAAVLAELAGQVWSVEIVEEFAGAAKARLRSSASRTCRSASATARGDGPSMRRSTESSSPPPQARARAPRGAAQARRPDGHADRTDGGATADARHQRCQRPERVCAKSSRPVHPA